MRPGPKRLLLAASTACLALAACSDGGTTASPVAASPGAPAGGTSVTVALSEWSVAPTPDRVPAGDVTFDVTNDGPEDPHEFVVLRTDLDFASLPTDANGAVTEDVEGIEVVDEVEDIPVGETQELMTTLTAGTYVLLCNIYDEAEQEAHYQMGMRIPFTVE
jgi:uncharacterized cupredoxin-like copper-binding protein